jgi:hypothetical protein
MNTVPMVPFRAPNFAREVELRNRADRRPPHVLDVLRVIHGARFPAPRPQLRMFQRGLR